VAKKAKFTVLFAPFTVYVGGGGWLKTSEYRHTRKRV